ncbi:[FeFe] hydrogenase H-cluster maturation GTPase HydF [Shewanella marina]|uniref:[FeFe] hydrogenase H-cluster maturation GTPase HydF n=1 Tax=Shewanella marina TaxID=487319 RepID=UPI0004703909|nr:[FeFe] hydrogenase H-cluster maturation GTPase HydF [Shewanella marina]
MSTMIANSAPRGVRYQIALIGRRNAGKSSLFNLLTGQDIAIVSDTAGTTTDAISKPYELLPLGPVTFYDTAGLDDEGELGLQRIKASLKILYRADICLLVTDEQGLTAKELQLIEELQQLKIPFLIIFNKADISDIKNKDIDYCQQHQLAYLAASSTLNMGADQIKQAIYEIAPAELKQEQVLASDLYQAGETVLCVVPIDMSAPKGRLILPQVQVLREALDHDAMAIVVKESQLAQALAQLNTPPAIVIADSQVIKQVTQVVPENVPLTTFSTLFARFKGDLAILAQGADALDNLQDGDKIMMAEACSHHSQEDDIGRVKLPNMIKHYSQKQLTFDIKAGHDFPDNLADYALVVHCGSCMLNRTEMIRRVRECERRNIPVTNYGVAISKIQGVLPRVMQPFIGK